MDGRVRIGAVLVVDPKNVENLVEPEFDGRQRTGARGGDGPGRILPVAGIDQRLAEHRASGLGGFRNLVPNAPDNDARVIAIPAKHAGQVLLRPLVKEAAVAFPPFALLPFVKALIHHHDSHLVAEIEQLGRWRIVTRAQGIASHLLQDFQLSLVTTLERSGPQATQVGMITSSLDLHVLAVQQKSLVLRKFQGANADGRGDGIDQGPLHADFRDRMVERRRVWRPKLRLADSQILIDHGGRDGSPQRRNRKGLA